MFYIKQICMVIKMVCIFGAIKKLEIQTTNLTLNSIIKSIVVEIVQNTCTCICKTCIPIWNNSGCLHCAHFLLYKCINVYDFCLQGNFFHNLGSILVFAILGTVVSALVVGGGIYLLGQVPVLFFYWISNNLKYWSIYLYLKIRYSQFTMHALTQHSTPVYWVNLKYFIIEGCQVYSLQTFLQSRRFGDREHTSHLIKFINHGKLGQIVDLLNNLNIYNVTQ